MSNARDIDWLTATRAQRAAPVERVAAAALATSAVLGIYVLMLLTVLPGFPTVVVRGLLLLGPIGPAVLAGSALVAIGRRQRTHPVDAPVLTAVASISVLLVDLALMLVAIFGSAS